jgi:phosphoribosylanthranilate isomerase
MPVRIKICGITNLEDARVAVQAGADALGFIFVSQSPRFIELNDATDIIHTLPPFVATVGVFVDASVETVRMFSEICGLDTLQFHGEESPSYCQRFTDFKVIKAFRIQDADSLQQLPQYKSCTSAWLLDSYVPGKPGGTGTCFNWDLATQAKNLGHPVILAGGLTPDNVSPAVQTVRPFGIDVSSGVESAPGRKDPQKIAQFIQAARAPGGL